MHVKGHIRFVQILVETEDRLSIKCIVLSEIESIAELIILVTI